MSDADEPPTPLSSVAAALGVLQLGSDFSRVMAAQFVRRALHGAATLEAAAAEPAHPFRRVAAWLLELAAAGDERHPESVLRPPSRWQRGCPEVLPHLSARPVWVSRAPGGDSAGASPEPLPSALAFVADLEAAAPAIRAEVLALRGQRAFQQYRAPEFSDRAAGGGDGGGGGGEDAGGATDAAGGGSGGAGAGVTLGTTRGDWNVLYLDLHDGDARAADRSRCPALADLLRRVVRRPYGHALLSAVAPGTHIGTHTGPTNKKLRVHVPLVVPPGGGCRLRVGPHVQVLAEGAAFVFDDSFQHEAVNEGGGDGGGAGGGGAGATRINLIVDVWHPDLSDVEVKFLSFVRASQLRRAKALSDAGALPAGADFFAVLSGAKRDGADDDVVFAGAGGGAPREPLAAVPVRDD
jgi:aspartate beta-hydroxylase